MTYINAVKRISELPKELSGSLERIKAILKALGSPQNQLKFIHITGDVGKNSCTEMLSSVLIKNGYSVGSYSLLQSGELRDQIKINGRSISHADFSEPVKSILTAAQELFGEASISQSDIMLLIAILCFEKNRASVAIIERALHGNDSLIADVPMLSVITSISDSETDISFNEIIHRGTHETVTSIQHKGIYSEISAACAEIGSRLTLPIYADVEVKKISLFKTVFTYRGIEYSLNTFSPCQLINAITVLEAAKAFCRLGGNLTDQAIAKGLSSSNLALKCRAVAIDPTIIVATVSNEKHIEALVASLAQVSDLIHGKISVYVSPTAERLAADIPQRLASCSIECDTPVTLPTLDDSGFAPYIKKLILPIAHAESTGSATVFLGDSRYIPELSNQIQKNLGNI